jgi:hypothetical protein
MKHAIIIFCMIFSMQSTFVYCTAGSSAKKQSLRSFNGTLISQENPDTPTQVMNIAIGREKESASTEHIVLFEKPKKHTAASDKNEIKLELDPHKELIVTYINLEEVSCIEVPHPHILWIYQANEKTVKSEFIELIITASAPQKKKMNYLLELGKKDTPRPIKLFCDEVDIPLESLEKNQSLETTTKKPKMCPLIDKKNMREQGVPFQAIKKLAIDGYCQKPLPNEQQ